MDEARESVMLVAYRAAQASYGAMQPVAAKAKGGHSQPVAAKQKGAATTNAESSRRALEKEQQLRQQGPEGVEEAERLRKQREAVQRTRAKQKAKKEADRQS